MLMIIAITQVLVIQEIGIRFCGIFEKFPEITSGLNFYQIIAILQDFKMFRGFHTYLMEKVFLTYPGVSKLQVKKNI